MNFETSRNFALKRLNNFIENDLVNYSKLRNFDYGPEKRSNISCLSPYITHGIINEIELIKKILQKNSFVKSEKFIQEILWRVYWKGWLELRPKVWSDYLEDLKKLKYEFKNNQSYLNAIEGKTSIECFDKWVEELINHNYLHNHARMWFASIWVFTLNLPWQLGAEFFMKHLYDGDSASNTLGWRWVSGIQTKGKNYLASEWNIKKFTNNRFNNINLIKDAKPIVDDRNYIPAKQVFKNPDQIEKKTLLIFDNNLSLELLDFNCNKFKKVFIVYNDNNNRAIKLSEKVIKFKKSLIEHQIKNEKNVQVDVDMISISNLKDIKEDFYASYPSVGENLDFMRSNKLNNIVFLYRQIDLSSWIYCNKGFFNFKNYIPKILQKFT
tara:strand:+ start:1004 stop:2149 length:1146 start_codon:yes stop_codon:yes gene_type:complete